MIKERLQPDYLFEVSWEVCNKVGGIHTVLATKSRAISETLEGTHVVIGPDIWHDEERNREFVEGASEFAEWQQHAQQQGLRVRVGHWDVPGRPYAILVDFTTLTPQKDAILTHLWERFKLDSIQGQWDYIEPVLFGYAAGKVIESFVRFQLSVSHRVLAQFHEWMTGSGLLYLKDVLPQVATVFTTHATVLGRSIAGNGMPLYDNLSQYDPEQMAREFNVVSKHSLERISAQNADSFTTVSEITGRECAQFHGKPIDLCTPNGFEPTFVPEGEEFNIQRLEGRMKLLEVAERLLGEPAPLESVIIGIGGRYEFKNKGLDLFIDALHRLNSDPSLDRQVLAFMLIPAGHHGPRRDIMPLSEDGNAALPTDEKNPRVTHYLSDSQNDPIMRRLDECQLFNGPESKVKVFYVPCYLDGSDGILNMTYYELLIGMDMTAFPSYYEPWGYTPLESLAFHVPTVTTSLAGFGAWAKRHAKPGQKGLLVLNRTDSNYDAVCEEIADAVREFSQLSSDEVNARKQQAEETSRIALWANLIEEYYKAYEDALLNAKNRVTQYAPLASPHHVDEDLREQVREPKWNRLMVVKNIPQELVGLDAIAHNLWWSWHPEAMALFESIDPALWEECEHNPIMLLESIAYSRLEALAKDEDFLTRLRKVKADFDAYMAQKPDPEAPHIAYLSMEYGLHSSLKLYSGGLGVLAGDYLKEASDRNINMVAIGLFYRYGYFTQTLTRGGQQIASYNHQNFTQTLAQPVRDADGQWVTVEVAMPGRNVKVRVWVANVGRIPLYLLDTDFEDNLEQDRSITYHLYGGDQENRFKQEMVLGIGGIRALKEIGIPMELLHLNEGHAAFAALERLRQLMTEEKLSFEEARELVRASSLFTTHTPVPAGHDRFDETLVRTYMAHYPERFTINWQRFISFGRINPADSKEKFSMSNLAANFCSAINGVSALHGKVSQEMFAPLWPGYYPSENHVGSVTNGVHYPTWIADAWRKVLHPSGDVDSLPEWKEVAKLPDKKIWDIRKQLRMRLVESIVESLTSEEMIQAQSPRHLVQIREELRPEVLTIGFARRFATYKRAHLLFTDLDRLKRLINHPERPVQFLFAGKAHPHDLAGQDLIKKIVNISQDPDLHGRLLFLPNYDMELANRMVQGVDVWLNTPTRPQEASGTSGMKAVMNGVLHFSVLDGWWVEGYVPQAGWAIQQERTYQDQAIQDELDASTIYSLIENEIAPMFYERNAEGVPTDWIGYIRRSMQEIAPRFSSTRMQDDYFDRFYLPLDRRFKTLRKENNKALYSLIAWKQRMLRYWDQVQVIRVERLELSKQEVVTGKEYHERVVLDVGQLDPAHIGVELVMAELTPGEQKVSIRSTTPFQIVDQHGTRTEYEVKIKPSEPGAYDLAIRIFAQHPLLPHRMDFNLVRWI